MRRIALGATAALALLVSSAAPTYADVGVTIIERCTHGQSVDGFSQKDYRRALEEATAEVNEYSDCANLIRKAQLAAAGRGGGGGGGETNAGGGDGSATSSVAPPTPAEQHALQRAHSTGAAPVKVGEETVVPGVVHANVVSAFSALPTPLLALLALMSTIVLLMLGRTIRDRVGSRDGD